MQRRLYATSRPALAALVKKPKIVIVGAGWAGFRVATDIDKAKFNVELVSPRNHFLFTPLLPSTAVGTLEFRTIQEPVRTIPNLSYHQASVESIDFVNSKVTCVDSFKTGHHFDLPYDALVVATGCETATFDVPGVIGNERVMFLKQLSDARAIRSRLIDCFERASSPACSADEAKRLLTFVVVGGGPTSVEFTAELYDFLKGDVRRWYPDLHDKVNIYLFEASGNILGAFHTKLVTYVESLFFKRNIHVMTKTAVAKVDGNDVHLADGTVMSFGLMVWSTGIKQLQLIQSLDGIAKFPTGRLKVDDHLRLLSGSDTTLLTTSKVFAMGDCAGHESKPLPALAQVASQQGIYLAEALNLHGLEGLWNAKGQGFYYSHLGAMASVGQWKGVYDSTNVKVGDKEVSAGPLSGFAAFALWRAAYWTKQVSVQNKVSAPGNEFVYFISLIPPLFRS